MNARNVISPLRLALLFVGAIVSSLGAQIAPSTGGRAVLTRDVLQDAGLTRISDLLFLVDEWTLNTTDGYTWKASPNGLAAFQRQQWVVMLDGQRMEVGFFEAVNLNLLPVALDEIDSVVVVNSPQFHCGVFAGNGLIHFFTATPRRGETFRAAIAGGGKTGDPGPYRHTTLRTPNIDSDGPDGAISFGIAQGPWSLRAGATVQVHYFTDIEIRRRVFDSIGFRPASVASASAEPRPESEARFRFLDAASDDTWPGMRRVGASLDLRYAGDAGRHEPFFAYSKAEHYYFYSEPLGREIPSDNRYLHAGVDGVFPLSPALALAYRLQRSSNVLSRRVNSLDFDYDWGARRTVADVELSRRWPTTRAAFGAGVDRVSVETGYALTESAINLVRLSGRVETLFFPRFPQEIGAMTTFEGGNACVGTYWHNSIKLDQRHRLETRLSFSQRSFAESNDLWYWTRRGYRMLDDNAIAYTLPEDIGTSETTTADLTWSVSLHDGLFVRATGYYRRFSGLYFGRRDFVLGPDDCVPTSPTVVESGVGGEAAGGAIHVDFRASKRMLGSVYYHYLDEFSGDTVFKEAWRAVPDHKAAVRLTFSAYDDLSFWAKMTYLSSTHWSDYDGLSGSVCRVDGADVSYSAGVGESTILDLKARKRLMRGKLTADAICRNAWNKDYRYHPVGASFDLSFYVRLNLSFHTHEGNP